MKNKQFTLGVEEEYMLCDISNGNLTNKANHIINSIPEKLKDRYSYELLLSEIESNTSICDNVDDCIEEILEHRNRIKNIANKYNSTIGISGTHPTALPLDQKFVDNDSYNWVSDQLQYYAKRNITFSLHVHIGLQQKEDIIHVTNLLRRWISPMLALSVNSPFFEGVKTGMMSSRTFQFSTFPRTNIPEYLNSSKEYENIIDKYIESESISKQRQIWWKIRPHFEYNTIEFRVCDIQRSISRTKMLIALIQALVHSCLNDKKISYNYEFLQDGLWKAARYGLDCNIVDPVDNKVISMEKMIKRMIDYIDDSLKYFNNKDVVDNINDIFSSGTEAKFQIDEYKKNGFDYLKMYLIDKVDYNI